MQFWIGLDVYIEAYICNIACKSVSSPSWQSNVHVALPFLLVGLIYRAVSVLLTGRGALFCLSF
jgi:hypothetical protein